MPELADTTVVLNGVAKSYAMTGWRLGWLIGPTDIVKAVITLQSHLTSNVNNIAQRAAIAALNGDQSSVEQMRQAFDRRRHLMVSMLREVPGFVTPEPKGAFYCYSSVKEVIGKSLRGTVIDSSATLADLVLEHAKVAIVPGEAFGPSGFVRLSYSLSDEDLVEGLERLQKLMAEVA